MRILESFWLLVLVTTVGCSSRPFSDQRLNEDLYGPENISRELGENGSPGEDSERQQLTDSRSSNGRFSTSDQVRNLEPKTSRRYQNEIYSDRLRATREDFVDQSEDEGSLWASGGQTNYFFTRNFLRSPGDIVVVTLENDLVSEITAEIKRTLTQLEKDNEVRTLKEIYRRKLVEIRQAAARKDSVSTTAAAPVRGGGGTESGGSGEEGPNKKGNAIYIPESAEELENAMQKASMKDINITPALEIKSGDTMMGEIIERYPNGNYKIRAIKRVQYQNGTPRLVSVTGVIKTSDINESTDSVPSGKLYETRIDIAH